MRLSRLPPLLRELKGAPLAVLIALRWLGQPAEQNWLQDATGYGRDTVRAGMRALERMGLATFDDGTYITNCQLTGAAQQLPLGYDLLDTAPAGTGEPSAATNQTDPAPLQAGVPLGLEGGEPGASAKFSHSDPLIIINESESPLLIKNNKGPATAKKSHSGLTERELGEHNAKIRAALIERGIEPRPGPYPLPVPLQACADALMALGSSRRRAEEAVAFCQATLPTSETGWTTDDILAQIKAWTSHCRSPITGKNVDGRMPGLIASKIELGLACPPAPADLTDPNRFDGLLAFAANGAAADQADDIPGAAPAAAGSLSALWVQVVEVIVGPGEYQRASPHLRQARLTAGHAPNAYQVLCTTEQQRLWLGRQADWQITKALQHLTHQPAAVSYHLTD